MMEELASSCKGSESLSSITAIVPHMLTNECEELEDKEKSVHSRMWRIHCNAFK